jgi:hypothetical protein
VAFIALSTAGRIANPSRRAETVPDKNLRLSEIIYGGTQMESPSARLLSRQKTHPQHLRISQSETDYQKNRWLQNPIKRLNWPYITMSGRCPSLLKPTNSFEEAFF